MISVSIMYQQNTDLEPSRGGPPRNSELAEQALNPLVSPAQQRKITPRYWEINGKTRVRFESIFCQFECVCVYIV